MQKRIDVRNLDESNIEDLICVCSSGRLSDPIHLQGVTLKRQWLRKMLAEYGSIAKIGYLDNEPVAQMLFYPEDANVSRVSTREDVLFVQCIYNPVVRAQKLGLATRLLQDLVRDARLRRTCLGNRKCRFILAKAFNAGEFLPLLSFYQKNGFSSTPEKDTSCLPIEGAYEPLKPAEGYVPLPEDQHKAIVFYDPTCQFGYQFAKKIEEIILEVAPAIRIESVNEWERPEESIKRNNCVLVVNAKPIRTFFMETEKFREEVRQAADGSF